jgi:hypothetical protein
MAWDKHAGRDSNWAITDGNSVVIEMDADKLREAIAANTQSVLTLQVKDSANLVAMGQLIVESLNEATTGMNVEFDCRDATDCNLMLITLLRANKLASLSVSGNNDRNDLCMLYATLAANPQLRSLMLKKCKIDARALALALAANTSLTDVRLIDNASISHTSSTPVAAMSSYDERHFRKMVGLDSLLRSQSITTLMLIENNIADVKSLGYLLATNTTLKRLTLSDKLHDVDPIVAALATNATLEMLDLSGNELESTSTMLGVTLVLNRTLKALHVADGGITSADAFAAAIASGSPLEELDLSGNPLGTINKLGMSLTHNTTLKTLGLSKTRLASIAPVTAALATNKTLEYLMLDGNQLLEAELEELQLEADSNLMIHGADKQQSAAAMQGEGDFDLFG